VWHECKDWGFVFVGHVWRDDAMCERELHVSDGGGDFGMWQAMQLLRVNLFCDECALQSCGPRAVEESGLWQSRQI